MQYAQDKAFLLSNNITLIELFEPNNQGKILISPQHQGRVMTSTASGDDGNSFGWINYPLIQSEHISPQFNPIGGEERLWIGPEGGQFSFYFQPGQDQNISNWVVPSIIDTEAFEVTAQTRSTVSLSKQARLINASNHTFELLIERTVSILSKEEIETLLGVQLKANVSSISYSSTNRLTNTGNRTWNKESGMPSIWLLSMFSPNDNTRLFIPLKPTSDSRHINDSYFGKVPSSRIQESENHLLFNTDGKYRSKIGVAYQDATAWVGSFDDQLGTLTLIHYTLPHEQLDYVNSIWGEQENPFNGDVINAYNDGPNESGNLLGPFYEIETSSPAAPLSPHESIEHQQTTIHLQGTNQELKQLINQLFQIQL